MGGCIESPRPSNKERQARNRRTSLFDVAGLASSDYHGGQWGKQMLDIPFIHLCGYRMILPAAAEDILLCYRDIQQVHKKVCQGWTNPRMQISGPSVEQILEKGILVFPKLTTLTAKDTVHFYDKLQELSAGYLLPLMPFDVIHLDFNFEGLFVPGLGTECYVDCAAALMEVLPRLIPTLDSEVQVAISAVRGESKNGYDLFWRILELAVPGFNPTIPIDQPWWDWDSDVLEFSREHELYFCLLAKKHVFIDVRTRTNMSLRAITSSEYANIVTNIQSHVDIFQHEDNNGFLPTHLRLRGIANLIHHNAKARVRDIGRPRIHRMLSSNGANDWPVDEYMSYHIQGSRPQVFRMEHKQQRAGWRFDQTDGQAMDSGGRCAHDRPDGRARELDRQNDDRRGIDHRNARPLLGRYPRLDKC
jgi:hypothetical protein